MATRNNTVRANTIKVGSFNCQGINNYYTRMAIFDLLKKSELEIIFLQETKLKPEFENQYVKDWHNQNCIFNCTVGQKHGTAILINVDYIKFLYNRLCDVEGRVIAVDVSVCGDIFHLVNSYGPNHHDLKVPFLNRLYVYLSSNRKTIWSGDHNIATNPSMDRFPNRLSSDHGSREFLDLVETFDFKDSCRTLYPNGSFFTFRRGSSKSRIDKILVSSQIEVNNYQHTETTFSDHVLISTTLQYVPNQNLGPGVWRNNVKYYQDEDFLRLFEHIWEAYKTRFHNRNNNLQKWWLNFKYFFKLKSIRFAKEKVLYEKREAQMKEQGLNNLILLLNMNPTSQTLLNQYLALKKQIANVKIKSIKERIFKEDAKYLMRGESESERFYCGVRNKYNNRQTLDMYK